MNRMTSGWRQSTVGRWAILVGDCRQAPLVLASVGAALQVLAMYSDSWLLLQLTLVPVCGGQTPIQYESDCGGKIQYAPTEVARAGLWRVCHSFPLGLIPEFYFRTEPYCSNFDDDDIPEEWMDFSRYLCQLSIMLSCVGLVLLAAENRLNINWNGVGSCILYTSATSAFLGALTVNLNMSKEFLMAYRLNMITSHAYWAFYCSLDGCLITFLAGVWHQQLWQQ